MKLKFQYSTFTPFKYKFKFGFEGKPLKYKFNFKVGDKQSSYTFSYDIRKDILNDNNRVTLVKIDKEVCKSKYIRLVKFDKLIFREALRSLILNRVKEISKENNYLANISKRAFELKFEKLFNLELLRNLEISNNDYMTLIECIQRLLYKETNYILDIKKVAEITSEVLYSTSLNKHLEISKEKNFKLEALLRQIYANKDKTLNKIVLRDLVIDYQKYSMEKGQDLIFNHKHIKPMELKRHKEIRVITSLNHFEKLRFKEILKFSSARRLLKLMNFYEIHKMNDMYFKKHHDEGGTVDNVKFTEKQYIDELLQVKEEKATDKLYTEEIGIDITKNIMDKILDEIYINNPGLLDKLDIKEIFNDVPEEYLELYKRFWIMKHTDSIDWLIVPNEDYNYKSSPIGDIKEHPIGTNSGLDKEVDVSIAIMVDLIAILIMLWSKFYTQFRNSTKFQSITRLMDFLYNWLSLETSIEEMLKNSSKDDYSRCFRWFRWESEKIALKYHDDNSLNGNAAIEELIQELMIYMEEHHFDEMPVLKFVKKMDEFRYIFTNVNDDITVVLDKVKGIRHRFIERKGERHGGEC